MNSELFSFFLKTQRRNLYSGNTIFENSGTIVAEHCIESETRSCPQLTIPRHDTLSSNVQQFTNQRQMYELINR